MHVQIDVNAYFTTPFTVGTGALADSLANKPIMKDGRNQPIIPGSSFKGRLRHTCEKLLRALQADDYAACRSPAPDATCPLDPKLLGRYCPICRLFGSPRRPSPLVFTDLHWTERELEAPAAVRTGVSIRRSRRVAEPQRLYSQETFAPMPETHYRGAISGHLVEADSQRLLALLLAGVRDLKTLGGSRSRGLGRCRLETTTRVDGRLIDDAWLREGLEKWLP